MQEIGSAARINAIGGQSAVKKGLDKALRETVKSGRERGFATERAPTVVLLEIDQKDLIVLIIANGIVASTKSTASGQRDSRTTKMINSVIFAEDALNDFNLAVTSRSKSLNKRFYEVQLTKLDSKDDRFTEVAELRLRKSRSHKSMTIRLNIWPDRWVWVDAREASATGWLWSFNAEGRIAGGKSWDDVVRCTEKLSEVLTAGKTEIGIREAGDIWARMLVKGPLGYARRNGIVNAR